MLSGEGERGQQERAGEGRSARWWSRLQPGPLLRQGARLFSPISVTGLWIGEGVHCITFYGKRPPARLRDILQSKKPSWAFSSQDPRQTGRCTGSMGAGDSGGNQQHPAVVLKSDSPGGLLKHRVLGPSPAVSDTRGLGRGPVICLSHRFPGDANAAGPRTSL